MNNTISKSQLTTLIKEIIRGVIKEGLAAQPSPVNPPKLGVYPPEFKTVKNYIRIKKSNVPGELVVAWFTNGKQDDGKSYYTNDLSDAYGTFKVMQNQVDVANGVVKEMTGTAAVSPVSTPFAFKKKNEATDDYSDESAGYNDLAEVVANNPALLRQMGREGLTEQDLSSNSHKFLRFIISHLAEIKSIGKFDFVKNPQDLEVDWYYETQEKSSVTEMTTTGAVSGYNVPGAFSKKGGSEAGLKGSEKLGFTLTTAGKQDMNRVADKLR